MMLIRCPQCQTTLQVKEEHGGMQVRCPKCQLALLVPKAQAPTPPPPAAPQAAPPPPPPRPAPPPVSPPAPPPPLPPRREEREVRRVPEGPDEPEPRPEKFARRRGASALASPEGPDEAKHTVKEKQLGDLPNEPLPEDCPREADALGEPLATMTVPSIGVLGWIGAGTLILFGFAFFIGSANMFMAKIDDPKKKANNDTGKWIVLVGGCAFLAFGATTIVLCSLQPAEAKLWFCPRGLVWKRKAKVGWCRWEEVRGLFRTSVRVSYSTGGIGFQNLFTFEVPGGEKFQFEGNGDSDERTFGERLQLAVTEAVLPLYADKFRKGKVLEFGPLRMDRDDLWCNNAKLAWKHVGTIEMALGVIAITDRDEPDRPWGAVAFGNVSNGLVFQALALAHLDELKEQRKARRREREGRG